MTFTEKLNRQRIRDWQLSAVRYAREGNHLLADQCAEWLFAANMLGFETRLYLVRKVIDEYRWGKR